MAWLEVIVTQRKCRTDEKPSIPGGRNTLREHLTLRRIFQQPGLCLREGLGEPLSIEPEKQPLYHVQYLIDLSRTYRVLFTGTIKIFFRINVGPDFLDICPIRHDAVLYWVRQLERAAMGIYLSPNESDTLIYF
jgi:hypothetical protein